MTQIVPKRIAGAAASPSKVLHLRIVGALVGGASAFALSAPLSAERALAEGWQETTQHYPGGWTTTYRIIRDGDDGLTTLSGPAPRNNCPVPAFEVVNPRRNEARCVGFVAPSWLR